MEASRCCWRKSDSILESIGATKGLVDGTSLLGTCARSHAQNSGRRSPPRVQSIFPARSMADPSAARRTSRSIEAVMSHLLMEVSLEKARAAILENLAIRSRRLPERSRREAGDAVERPHEIREVAKSDIERDVGDRSFVVDE